MTDRSPSTRAARAGGRPLARAAVLALLAGLVSPALAQPVVWEAMPGVRRLPSDPDRIVAVDFLRGEGAQADDPAADTLVVFSFNGGAFLYNPSGAAGAAGSNGDWGLWHRLRAASPEGGIVTAAGTLVMGGPSGATQLARGTGRGRVWAFNFDEYGAFPFFQTEHAEPVGAVLIGIGDGGETARSLGDGAPGTWAQVGTGMGYPLAFGEVPPSAALPQGRLLLGVYGGVRRSDDGGLSYTVAQMPTAAEYFAYSFTFAPDPVHPYGGVAYAGVHNLAFGEGAGAEVLRSDDGGGTWQLAHHFTAAEMALPVPAGTDVTEVALLATPDGALWAGVAQGTGSSYPPRGGVMRSADGGATWARADAGFRNAQGWGYAVSQLAVSRTGVLYAATFRGVWRTMTAVVAEEAPPSASPEVGLSVRPNPASGRAEVVVTLAEAGAVRVAVFDAQGREVAVAFDGALGAGERAVPVETGAWPAGVYVVRVSGGGGEASARLVVAR